VNCYNASGTAAKLYGYFDWNSDGDFGDTNEIGHSQMAPPGTNGTINLSVTVRFDGGAERQSGGAFAG